MAHLKDFSVQNSFIFQALYLKIIQTSRWLLQIQSGLATFAVKNWTLFQLIATHYASCWLQQNRSNLIGPLDMLSWKVALPNFFLSKSVCPVLLVQHLGKYFLQEP